MKSATIDIGKHNIPILRELFDYCHYHDVDRVSLKNGQTNIFDARTSAINIWSRPWITSEGRILSEMLGTVTVTWSTGNVMIHEISGIRIVSSIFNHLYEALRDKIEPSNVLDIFAQNLSLAENNIRENK